MLRKFLDFIRNEHLFDAKDKILIAVSGGMDSSALLYLCDKAGFNFEIAHCNFKLRGNESDDDESFVRDLASTYMRQIHCKSFAVNEYSVKNGISVQMAARSLRYEWFEELMNANAYNCCATAHHLDDNIETFFINLLRGSGISGLRGMLPKQGKLVRPLLFASKSDIAVYTRINKIPFREDSSNLSDNYLRNRIRHSIIPGIREIQPELESIMRNNLKILKEQELIFKEKIQELINNHVIKKEGERIVDLQNIMQYEFRKTILFNILIPYGANDSITDEILHSGPAASGKIFHTASHEFIINRGTLIIREKKEDPFNINVSIPIQKDCNYWEIEEPVHLKFNIVSAENIIIIKESNYAFLDYSIIKQLNFLTLRKWQKGDYFFPFGMSGKKLLSDYFIDEKYSLTQKEATWLLCAGNKVVWIIGRRIDNRFRVTAKTTEVLTIFAC